MPFAIGPSTPLSPPAVIGAPAAVAEQSQPEVQPSRPSQRADRAEISELGYRLLAQAEAADRAGDDPRAVDRPGGPDQAEDRSDTQAEDLRGLSEEELRQVEEMAQRDREVRQHEMAHLAAAGPYARGGMSLRFERGPDGRAYAVAGSVNIDTGPESDPQRTIAKMQQVQRAALAPAQPSSQDRMVAAQAGQRERAARAEYMQQQAQDLASVRDPDQAEALAAADPVAPAAGPSSGRLQMPGLDLMA